jgi:hypothetical protein
MTDDKAAKENWRRWGPYVSERQRGAVRENHLSTGTQARETAIPGSASRSSTPRRKR